LNGYAFIANSHNNRELTIVNVGNPASPTLAGFFNSPGNLDGRGVAVSGNRAYLVTDNNTSGSGFEFYVINVTNKASPTQLGGLNLNAAGRDVFLLGNYAYLASTHNNQELQVVNTSNPASPTLAGSYNSPGNSDGQGVQVEGSTAFMTDARVNILNVTNPASISLISQPNYPGSPRGIFASGNFAFLASTDSAGQFKVVDITNPASPVLYGQTSLGDNGLGVFVLGDYAFVITANNGAEFQIVRGGLPGNPYQTDGVFESQTFDAGNAVVFNFLNFAANEPGSTNIQIQVAINNDNTTWIYRGPDGTSGSYFESAGAVPLASALGRYFRFRVSFSGNGTNTPSLFSGSVNYSP
jgi:hypothetical protein